jgi:protoheme IX farnesyltransferase
MSDVLQAKAFSGWRDYYEMCKPRVVLLMLLCTLVGMFLATNESVPLDLIVYCLVGVALVAGSAAALNHLVDATVDQKMARTEQRPVAQGRVSMAQGLVFVAVTGGLGLAILAFWVNPLTAGLNFLAWLGYGVIYSLYLKRATSQNIVIGGLFGAAPPLFGWTAVTNSVDGGGLLLVLIIFAWTPPHFWALAIYRREDYAAVNIPMLPVTHGVKFTRLHILLYTIVLFIVSLLPYLVGMSGFFYLVGAVLLGGGFLYYAIRMQFDHADRLAMQTFSFSIIYLMAMFAFLLIDHYIPLLARII